MQDISALVASFKDGTASPYASMVETIDAIEASQLNSFITVDREGALAAAAMCEQISRKGASLGPLHGIAVGIKDLIDVAGLPSTMGSEQFVGNIARRDSQSVATLRAAGAVIVGKTNMHEFAYGGSGDRSHFGAVHNPWDPDRMSGGSSSGSGAAVGAGLILATLGTDTSASVRLPASLCGAVGMKPTYELLSRDGVFPLSEQLDHVGPITASVAGNALLMDVLASSGDSFRRATVKPIASMTVGVPCEFYKEYLAAEVRDSLENAERTLRKAGARVIPVDIVGINDIYLSQQLILRAEAHALHEQSISLDRPFSAEVLARLKGGGDVSAAEYLAALRGRAAARAAFDTVLDNVDILLTATCGITAPLINERTTELAGEKYSTFWLLTRLTAPTNFTGHPSLSVPFGSAGRLPIGMQLIGRYHDEATLYRFAIHLERENNLA